MDFRRVAYLVLTFAERHLTPISIGVLVIGVTLIAIGPVKGALSRARNASEAAGEQTGEVAMQPVTFPQGTGGGNAEAELVFERAPQPFTIIPNRQRDEVLSYTVQSGDTIFALADAFGLNMETIFWANSETLQDNVHLLVPGVNIFILPIDGIYYRANGKETIGEIADKFYADADDILDPTYNELPPDSDASFVPPLGMRLIIPGGQREAVDFAWAAPAPGGAGPAGSGSSAVFFAPGHPGSCSTPIGGGAGSGVFGMPIVNYNVSQGFAYGHNGIDLSSDTGEPVYAADSGQVVFAGWNNWGYGNLVAINHGAWTTLYAHLSSVTVGCGQNVSRGTQVGGVGSTGNSSGPHLHFEMRYGTSLSPDNPAAYFGF